MTNIVETGAGTAGANMFVSTTFVDTFLADRGRSTENSWSSISSTLKGAAIVEGTDFIEARFGELFRGRRQYTDISNARATLAFTAQPIAAEIVTIGTIAYQFVSSLAAANDVLIGDTLADSIENLLAAVAADSSFAGIGFHAGTVANADATAAILVDDSIAAFSKLAGTRGGSVVTTTDVTGATWNFATLTGGSNIVTPQPLSFPRSSLTDRDGNVVVGIPLKLKYATAEYSVRAAASTGGVDLAPDPTLDPTGGLLTSIDASVGPIKDVKSYLPGTSGSGRLPVYPAADRLLSEYLAPPGTYR